MPVGPDRQVASGSNYNTVVGDEAAALLRQSRNTRGGGGVVDGEPEVAAPRRRLPGEQLAPAQPGLPEGREDRVRERG